MPAGFVTGLGSVFSDRIERELRNVRAINGVRLSPRRELLRRGLVPVCSLALANSGGHRRYSGHGALNLRRKLARGGGSAEADEVACERVECALRISLVESFAARP